MPDATNHCYIRVQHRALPQRRGPASIGGMYSKEPPQQPGRLRSANLVLPATLVEGERSPTPAEPHRAPPPRIGKFLILRVLGAGGMGVVYAAYDEELDRKVAIKLLRAGIGDLDRGAARMLREAQAMARLSHPNVAQIHEVGEIDERVFIAMEFIDGHDAREWQTRATRDWREVLSVYLQAGHGLAAAHAAGLIHRDFKPDNVLVGDDGRVCVADFGLVLTGEESQAAAEALPSVSTLRSGSGLNTRLTATQAFVGTPAYMAPEQHLHDPVDARADQFSFCASLYEALHGVRPFAGVTREEICNGMLLGKMVPPPRRNEVPAHIHAALLRGLAVDREHRWPDMHALLLALAPRPRHALLLGAGLASLLLAGVVGAQAVAGGDASACAGAAAQLAPVWDPTRREAVRTAFARTTLPLAGHTSERVVTLLDDYADAWARTYRAACEAHQRGEQSSDLLDRRMRCLASRLADLGAVADVLADVDDAVAERAVQTAAALPPISRCSDSEALLAGLTPPRVIADVVARARAQLSGAAANRRAGRVESAKRLVEQATVAARALDYPPLLAEALQIRGEVEDDLGWVAAALATENEAFALALSLGHDAIAAEIATSQIFRTGVTLVRHEVADVWARNAEALLQRAAAGPEGWIYFHRTLGALHKSKGELPQARERFERALALSVQQPAYDHVATAALLNNFANTTTAEGDYALARQRFERAIAIYTTELGPDHPSLVRLKTNLGHSMLQAGDLPAAEAIYREALALCERLRGRQQLQCAEPLTGLGSLLARLGQYDEAQRLLERAIESYEATLGPDSPQLGSAVFNLGCMLLERGDATGARVLLERSQRINRAARGETYELLPFELTELARVAIALDDPVAARPLLEQALAYREHHPAGPEDLADTRFELARLLAADRQRLPHARELARLAELALRDLPAESRRHAEVKAWLDRFDR